MLTIVSPVLVWALFVSPVKATTFEVKGPDATSICEGSGNPSVTPFQATEWGSETIYPLQVCPQALGSVASCGKYARSSLITLTVNTASTTEHLTAQFAVPLEGTTDQLQQYCHVFDPCQIARAFVGTPLDDSRVRAKITLIAKQPDTDRGQTYKTWLRASFSYIRDTTQTISPASLGTHSLLSVLCKDVDCNVNFYPADPTQKTVQRFKIVPGKAPQCDSSEVATGLLSVTFFVRDPTLNPVKPVDTDAGNPAEIKVAPMENLPPPRETKMTRRSGAPVATSCSNAFYLISIAIGAFV